MKIKLYWWRGDSGKENFGDYLSPLIVEMVSGKEVVYAKPEKADMIAIGSILHRERKAKRFFIPRKLHIWGAGTDSPDRRFSSRHYYHAVRGLETSSRILNPPMVTLDCSLISGGMDDLNLKRPIDLESFHIL